MIRGLQENIVSAIRVLTLRSAERSRRGLDLQPFKLSEVETDLIGTLFPQIP